MLNEFYKNIGIKGFFERYGVVNAVRRGAFMANPFHIVKDYEARKVLWQNKATKKIEKYLSCKECDPEGLIFGTKEVNDPVWVYWNTKIEQAPILVQKCYESLLKYSGKEVILLNEKTVDEYVKFPQHILEKKENKSISIAAYTDLLRFSLLEHYGGIWIDATVLLTDKIPQEILDTDFFVFQNTLGLLKNPVLCPAWFMRCRSGNQIMRQVRNVAFAYWTKEKHVHEYLFGLVNIK